MNSTEEYKQNKPAEPFAFTGWGTFGGAAIGLIIGLFTQHWLACTVGLAVVGWITGAVIDRSRMK